MHARLLVLVDKDEETDTSSKARKKAYNLLCENQFIGGEGLFSQSPADWFVVGGRWSGDLSLLRLDKEKLESFRSEIKKQGLVYLVDSEKERGKISALFKNYFPDFPSEVPDIRNSYSELGYDDDAQIVDNFLYNLLHKLKGYPSDALLDDLYEGDCYVDLGKPFAHPEEMIGNKWCVVVDFHY